MKYIYLSLIFLYTGCTGIVPEKKGVIFQRDGVSTLLMDSGTREVYFKDSHSSERHCRAPGPDVSIESSSGISLGASLIGKSEELSDTSGQSGLALGGRDPAVLLTRELMYRACELASNLNANQKTTIAIYNRFLKTVEKSIKMQQLVGTASASSSENSSLKNIVLQNQSLSNATTQTTSNLNKSSNNSERSSDESDSIDTNSNE